jgi:hypothetical protein
MDDRASTRGRECSTTWFDFHEVQRQRRKVGKEAVSSVAVTERLSGWSELRRGVLGSAEDVARFVSVARLRHKFHVARAHLISAT